MAKVCVEFDAGNGGEPVPAIRTFSQVIGDGTSTSYAVTHGFSNADVLYTVRNLATGEVDVYDVAGTSQPDVLTLSFAAPLPVNSARVTVLSLAAQA